MKRIRTALCLAGVALTVSTLATDSVSANTFPLQCPTKATKTLQNENGTIDAVDYKSIDNYRVKLAPGNWIIAMWSPGDIDMRVCVPGKRSAKVLCYSHNSAAFIDGCIDEGLNSSTSGLNEWGPPVKGGQTVTVQIMHCVDGQCGYADLPANVPLPYGLTIQAA